MVAGARINQLESYAESPPRKDREPSCAPGTLLRSSSTETLARRDFWSARFGLDVLSRLYRGAGGSRRRAASVTPPSA